MDYTHPYERGILKSLFLSIVMNRHRYSRKVHSWIRWGLLKCSGRSIHTRHSVESCGCITKQQSKSMTSTSILELHRCLVSIIWLHRTLYWDDDFVRVIRKYLVEWRAISRYRSVGSSICVLSNSQAPIEENLLNSQVIRSHLWTAMSSLTDRETSQCNVAVDIRPLREVSSRGSLQLASHSSSAITGLFSIGVWHFFYTL